MNAIGHWLQENPHRRILDLTDADYPPLLKQTPNPPKTLFVEGCLELLTRPTLAIIGSRNASITGIETAHHLAQELASQGLVICSGLAVGIDTASHSGALMSGTTIAVLGTGIDRTYPRSNAALQHQIAKQGLLISEFPLGTPPLPSHFPRRNRIIAGLSLGVLVVEAAEKSGSLITAHLALDFNREVFAIPGSIRNPLTKGCHQLLRQGAKLVESSEDIYDELPTFIRQIQHHENPIMSDLNKNPCKKLAKPEQLLVKCIGYEPTPLDVLVKRSGLSVSEIGTTLLQLELLGMVSRAPNGYVRIG